MVQTIECTVMLPAAEVVIHRAARRQVFRDRTPLATRSKNIHQAVHDLAYIHRSLIAATPGSRDHPLGYAIVGGLMVSQLLTLFTTPVIYLKMEQLRLYVTAWRNRRHGGVSAPAGE